MGIYLKRYNYIMHFCIRCVGEKGGGYRTHIAFSPLCCEAGARPAACSWHEKNGERRCIALHDVSEPSWGAWLLYSERRKTRS